MGKTVNLTNLRGGPYLPIGQQCRPIDVLEPGADVFRVTAFHDAHRTEKDEKLSIGVAYTISSRSTEDKKEGGGAAGNQKTWVSGVQLGLTPMGAMTIWSTATLLESAAKLPVAEPSLRVRRGNLSSRYLFQRPMMGPDGTSSTGNSFAETPQGQTY